MKNDIKIESKYLHDYNFINNPLVYGDVYLYQLGEIYCDNNAVVAPHVHDDFIEISYIFSGTGMFISDNKKQMVKAGDCFLSLPFEKHEIISDTYEPLRYFYITVGFNHNSEFRKILFNDKILSLEPMNRIYHSDNFNIYNAFNSLISAFESKNDYSELKFELMLKTFCLDIYEIFTNSVTASYVPPTISSVENIYYNVTKYIDNNLLSIQKLSEISTALNHNYTYLSRIFKSKFGQTLYEYYSNQKIKLAKRLIEEGNMSLTEISNYLNYSSVYVFSRSFKNTIGVSPENYKKSLNAK